MEITKVKGIIEHIIREIGTSRKEIEAKGLEKAKTIALYDLKLGEACETLRNETNLPASLIERVARKLCHKEREKMETADVLYKACISNLEALKAQLNGYQSIYKHLDSV
jgi:hypothetical protein